MAELSKITTDRGFTGWDDEVLVFDVGVGAPVLLMRPATMPGAAPDVEPETEREVEPEAVAETTDVEEFSEDAGVFAAPPLEEAPVNTEPVGTFGLEPVTDVDETWAAAVLETSDEPEGDISLKEALLRTAVRMESEGIVAPESVGPVDHPDDQAVAEPQSELLDNQPEAAVTADGAEELGDAPAWPWDVDPSATEVELPAFELSPFEAPGTDEGSLVRAPGDDETMHAARPVIMGSYSEGDDPPAESGDTPSEENAQSPGVDAMPVVETDSAPEEPAASAAADSEMSDFILDLEDTAPVAAAPGYEGGETDLTGMTCDDCVYVQTCPHKEGSDPRTCGSFQWK
jgi:hypothetical protein